MIIVTTNEIPGYRIVAVHGEVMGLTVRSRDFATQWVAGWRSMAGGEIPEYTQALHESRLQVMGRMVAEAEQRGANAIVAMRFDASEIAQAWTEICAYGTAVIVEPIPGGEPGATIQSAAVVQQQRMAQVPMQYAQGMPQSFQAMAPAIHQPPLPPQ